MEIGMSLACFYPMEPERAADRAAALNIGVCEVFINTYCETEEQYLYELRAKCDACGIKIHSIHPFTSALENYMFFSPYSRRIVDSTNFYRRYADVAKILGAKVINIHGDRGIGLQSLQEYANCVAPLLKLQEQTGIIYAMENVYYNSVDHPEFVAQIRQLLPEIRFTLDIKQAFKGGQDPYLLAEAMGNSIVNFHVNDRDETHLCLLPGQGTVDYERLNKILCKNGYNGPALIEVYSNNFKSEQEIADAKSLLESKFSLQNWGM